MVRDIASRDDMERHVVMVQAALGEAAFAAAWTAGRAMSLEEAIRYALQDPGADIRLGQSSADANSLREHDVAAP
jgi:hypothetical protein